MSPKTSVSLFLSVFNYFCLTTYLQKKVVMYFQIPFIKEKTREKKIFQPHLLVYFFVWYKRPKKHWFFSQKFQKLSRCRIVVCYFTVVMEKLLNIVREESSSDEFDQKKNIPIWDYVGISKFEYQSLCKIAYF